MRKTIEKIWQIREYICKFDKKKKTSQGGCFRPWRIGTKHAYLKHLQDNHTEIYDELFSEPVFDKENEQVDLCYEVVARGDGTFALLKKSGYVAIEQIFAITERDLEAFTEEVEDSHRTKRRNDETAHWRYTAAMATSEREHKERILALREEYALELKFKEEVLMSKL